MVEAPDGLGQVLPALGHGALGPEEAAQEVQRHTQHGGQRKGPAHGLAPPRVHVGVVVDQRLVVHNVEDEDAHADQWGEEGPAPFHPGARSVPDHTGNVVHEAVRSIHPGHHHALPKCLPEQGGATGRVVVKQLEDVHPAISHHGEIDDKAEGTTEGHRDLPLETEVVGGREEVEEAGDEAFHTYKLAVETKQQQHEEEQGSPEWGHWHQCDSPRVGDEGQARP